MAPTLVSHKLDPEQVAFYSWVIVQTTKHLMRQFASSVLSSKLLSATEYAAAFIVGQAAISTLTDLGYPQNETDFCVIIYVQ